MKSRVFVALALQGAAVLFSAGAAAQQAATPYGATAVPTAVQIPVVPYYSRSTQVWRETRTAGAPGSAALMTNHGGSTLSRLATRAIFWGPSWRPTSDKVVGLDSFLRGWSNSNAARAAAEYRGATANIPYAGRVMDASAVTPRAGENGSGAAVIAEICKVTNNRPDAYTHYAVFSETKRGANPYCAFHSAGSCPSTRAPFTYSWYFNLDGDAGCDPRDTTTGRSQGLAAVANVLAHELNETVTDPGVLIRGNVWYMGVGAWYDAAGYEIGDKCGWTFGAPFVTLSNGTRWKLQGWWSNRAFMTGRGGYANMNGQRGCV
jgi:hypothetical protein